MTLVVPLSAVPSQSLTVTLNGQSCQLNVYQKNDNVFMDVYVGTTLITAGVLCLTGVRIVQYAYLGFLGDLAFTDTLASANVPETDPTYLGLGAQYILVYFLPGELT